jgi:transcriptional regulator with XRE-family HTH domain
MKCIDYLNQINKLHGITDYRIAKEIGVTRQAVSSYRSGIHFFSGRATIGIAKLLDIDPFKVWMDVEIDRNKDSEMTKILQSKYTELFGTPNHYITDNQISIYSMLREDSK